MNTYKDIGSRLRSVMKEKNLNNAGMANLLDVSPATVSQWLAGKKLTSRSLQCISEKMDISVNWLVFGEGHYRRASSLKIDAKEEALLGIIQHIHGDLSRIISEMIEKIVIYQQGLTVNNHLSADKIFALTKLALATINFNGKLLHANAFYTELLGFEPNSSSIRAASIYDISAPEYRASLKKHLQHIKESGKGEYHYHEFIHQQNQQRIAVIIKASITTVAGEAVCDILIKPVDQK